MEKSKFFNSAPGDPRVHYASDFAEYFGDVLSSGLLHTDKVPALQAVIPGTDLRTIVKPGKAIIHGYAYENTSDLELTHGLPEATLDRIDRIVLRLDKRNQSRFIRLFIKQGDANANPVPPALQRDEFIHELSLAQVRVRANTSTLMPADLKDERLNEQLCGLVHSLISIPTTQFQEQWDLWFNTKTPGYEKQWNDWFGGIQNQGFASNVDFNTHKNDKVVHITSAERTKWNTSEQNAKDYTDTAPEAMQMNMDRFMKYKSGKDVNGTYTIVEYKRADNTLYAKSVLSGGTSPNYTTRTITYYGANGTTEVKRVTKTLSYDAEGDLAQEV